ncbi:MAG: TMEM175 family protein [Gemmatimonadales bacterium]|jgi:uncharacterized membrane protein
MSKQRLEAFSDGVIAIIITVMVLELKPPRGVEWSALATTWPSLLSYVLSFVLLGIYWNNHHLLLLATRRITGAVLWANLHLLFWLSLVPFTTSWLGESHGAPAPTAVYGIVLLCAAIAYTILLRSILAAEGPDSTLAAAVGSDRKGNVSLLLYVTAIPLSFYQPYLADALFVAVALIWLIPDSRIERRLE